MTTKTSNTKQTIRKNLSISKEADKKLKEYANLQKLSQQEIIENLIFDQEKIIQILRNQEFAEKIDVVLKQSLSVQKNLSDMESKILSRVEELYSDLKIRLEGEIKQRDKHILSITNSMNNLAKQLNEEKNKDAFSLLKQVGKKAIGK